MSTGLSDQARVEYLRKVDAAVTDGKLSATAAENLKRWLSEPPYAEYFGQLASLIDAGRFDQLQEAFWEVIPFGTGGRRGPMGDLGTATVNPRTIAESAHGVAVYLKRQKPTGGRAVVAHDTRNRSPEFARITACTLAAHGLKVFFFPSHRATPELSFAVRYLKCDVGVMISASHNPPSDNGFKAYWDTGCQVLPPHDQEIIKCVYAAKEIPTVDFDGAVQEGRIVIVGEEVDDAYIKAVTGLSLSSARQVRGLYTPLHGVGETSVYRVLQAAGFTDTEVFELQREPNGDFPNVPDHFPNPEQQQVFGPAIEHAQQAGHDLILASDPDADRLAVAVRGADGRFVCLTGNQLGALLVDYILRKRSAAGSLSEASYVAETLVTTPLIAAIARAYQVDVVSDLLVGFKYIGQTMDQRGAEGFVFGAEESLGYLAGDYCRDKDAAIAALYTMELAAELLRQNKTLLDRLDELYLQHGYYAETQQSIVCKGDRGRQQIEGLMARLRSQPPDELAGWSFTAVRDYKTCEVRRLPENQKAETLPGPEGDLLIFEAGDSQRSMRFAARPSGTEPKIKFYLFARSACPDAESLSSIKQQTDGAMRQFGDALTDWLNQALAGQAP